MCRLRGAREASMQTLFLLVWRCPRNGNSSEALLKFLKKLKEAKYLLYATVLTHGKALGVCLMERIKPQISPETDLEGNSP